MANYNRVILLGNLTRDPEVRYTPQGTPVANFGLAINHRYRQGEEQREETCFVDIVAFGRQAELVGEYLSKGRSALIEGRLQYRTWESQDGAKRSKHEVVAQSVQFMPQSGQGGQAGQAGPAGDDDRRPRAQDPDEGAPPPSPSVDDDIPF
jgi:single-strand DNA-binding protein